MRSHRNALTEIVVWPGECRVTTRPGVRLVTHDIGACIALAVHIPSIDLAALVRFVLPDSKIQPEVAKENPWLFADTAIPRFLAIIREYEVSRQDMSIRAIGGAKIAGQMNSLSVAKGNLLALRRTLWKEGVLLDTEDIGGNSARSVWFETSTGRLIVRADSPESNSFIAATRKIKSCHLAS